jgi:acylphosphatase
MSPPIRIPFAMTASTSNHLQKLIITGDLAAASFLPWVARHSVRLGLRCEHILISEARVELSVEGQAEMIDALEVGCLLGPIDAWIETIERQPMRFPV